MGRLSAWVVIYTALTGVVAVAVVGGTVQLWHVSWPLAVAVAAVGVVAVHSCWSAARAEYLDGWG